MIAFHRLTATPNHALQRPGLRLSLSSESLAQVADAMENHVKCLECEALILQSTADRHHGNCLLCCFDAPHRSNPIDILVVDKGICFAIPGPQLLEQLHKTKPIGGDGHPNRLELEAQRALIQHAIDNRVNRRLNDDLWQQTSAVAAKLFERGVGQLLTVDQAFRFSDIKKKEWTIGTQPLMQRGGFMYTTSEGIEIYRRWTWMS